MPGSRPDLFPKALASAADSLSFDLEDSVNEADKAAARANIRDFLLNAGPANKLFIVRVNALDTRHFEADMTSLRGCPVHLVNVPKMEAADDVHRALRSCPEAVSLLANIETPRGVRLAAEIATAHPRVAALQVGFVDLFSQCGIAPDEVHAKYGLRLSLRLAAAEAGIAIFDSAYANVKDSEGFRAEALAAHRLGFAGKSCIHPSQVLIANEVFLPSPADLAWANAVVTAARQNPGAFLFNGEMIDKPILERARAILKRAETN